MTAQPASAYTKVTLETFKAKLKANGYDSATAARRAVGKASWSDDEKDSARKAIDKHFGAESAPAKSAKSASAAPAKRGRPAKAPEEKVKSAKATPAVPKPKTTALAVTKPAKTSTALAAPAARRTRKSSAPAELTIADRVQRLVAISNAVQIASSVKLPAKYASLSERILSEASALLPSAVAEVETLSGVASASTESEKAEEDEAPAAAQASAKPNGRSAGKVVPAPSAEATLPSFD